MTDNDEAPPPYALFLLVLLFFITGLFGFLFCHLLKTKGYQCQLEEDEEGSKENAKSDKDDASEQSEDTVENILKCIIKNEANMEAFNEMLGVKCEHQRSSHKHSVGVLGSSSCSDCKQEHTLQSHRRSRVQRGKAGEQTVLSVGRFRVTHTEKEKNSLPGEAISNPQPGDSLNPQNPLDYNIHNMFSTNPGGVNSNGPKRKKDISQRVNYQGIDSEGPKTLGHSHYSEDKLTSSGLMFALAEKSQMSPEILESF